MSGMFEPKDGDFASYIKNFNAKTIEKFSAKSKALLTKQQDSFKAQDPDFSKKADAQFSAEPQHPSPGVTIAVYLFFAVVILGISGVIWGVCYLLFDSGLRTFLGIFFVLFFIFIILDENGKRVKEDAQRQKR